MLYFVYTASEESTAILTAIFFYMLECSKLAVITTGLRQSHFKTISACRGN